MTRWAGGPGRGSSRLYRSSACTSSHFHTGRDRYASRLESRRDAVQALASMSMRPRSRPRTPRAETVRGPWSERSSRPTSRRLPSGANILGDTGPLRARGHRPKLGVFDGRHEECKLRKRQERQPDTDQAKSLKQRPSRRGQHQRGEEDQVVARVALPQLDPETRRTLRSRVDQGSHRPHRGTFHPVRRVPGVVSIAGIKDDLVPQGNGHMQDPAPSWSLVGPPRRPPEDECQGETKEERSPGRFKRLDEPGQSS